MLRPSDSKCLPSWADPFPFSSCEPVDLFSGDDGWVPRRLCTKGTGITEQKGDCSIHWQEEVASSTALLRGRFQSHKTLRALSAFPEDETYDLPQELVMKGAPPRWRLMLTQAAVAFPPNPPSSSLMIK